MNTPLPNYAAVKDKICIAYLGHRHDLVKQLEVCRPLVEQQLPGLRVYLCVRPELTNTEVIAASEIAQRVSDFGYIYEVLDNGVDNPVQLMMEESGLTYPAEIFAVLHT